MTLCKTTMGFVIMPIFRSVSIHNLSLEGVLGKAAPFNTLYAELPHTPPCPQLRIQSLVLAGRAVFC